MSARLLIISTAGDPAFGAERLLASFLRALPRPFSQQCFLVRPPHSSLARWTADCPVQTIDFPAKRDAIRSNLAAALAISDTLRGLGIGLVHAWGARAFDTGLLLGNLLGVPVSATLHDHPMAAFHGVMRRMTIRFCATRLSAMVCVSNAVAEACWAANLRARVAVIHNGAPTRPPVTRARGTQPIRVAFLGLYTPWKGFHIIRDWIQRTGSDIEWHLYGGPPPDDVTAHGTGRLEPSKNVFCHGWVESDTILDEMDILIHASTGFEPFGMVLVEAARAGIPAIASDFGGTKEIVIDGETGFLFSPSAPDRGLERLKLLVSNPDLRHQMGVAARRRFESAFTIDRMVDSYVALWLEQTQK